MDDTNYRLQQVQQNGAAIEKIRTNREQYISGHKAKSRSGAPPETTQVTKYLRKNTK
jgi:hypothetical protein